AVPVHSSTKPTSPARGPFCDSSGVNSTRWPSRSSSKTAPRTEPRWKKCSVPRSSRMNPNPLSSRSRAIVPLCILLPPSVHQHSGRHSVESLRSLTVRSWLTSDSSAQAGLARRVSARFQSRRGRDRSRRPSLCCDGSLRRTRVFVALGKNLFDLGVRAGNDVYGHELTDAPRSGGPGVCRSVHCADGAAHHHGHIAGADVFLADQHDVCSLHHRVSCLERRNKTF